MEPTPQDLAAVSAVVDGSQPTPQPTQPAPQQQPTEPTPQPTPSQQQNDPFASMFASEQPPTQPTQPTEPVPTPQPQQPVETSQPTPQEPTQPEKVQTYEEYVASVLEGVPEVPTQPDPSKVNPDDPEAIKGFFDEMFVAAEKRFEANYSRKQAFQAAESKLWDAAFDKYPSLKAKSEVRDMVHAIRRSEFSKGNAITPTQAAEKLLGAINQSYRAGIADNQVVTTIESVQPTGGNGTDVATSIGTTDALEAVQTGGEEALAQILDAQFKSQN